MALSFQPFISSSPGSLVTQKAVRDRAAVGPSSVAWQGKAQQPDPCEWDGAAAYQLRDLALNNKGLHL